MKKEVKIPPMGESIVEVHIGELFKQSGSTVTADTEILEIETDKVNQSLYAPVSGLLTLLVKTGDSAKIGQVIGFIEETDEKAPVKQVEPKITEVKQVKEEPLRITPQKFLEETPTPVQKPLEKVEDVTRKKMSKIRSVIAERLVQSLQNSAMLTTFNEIDMKQVMALRGEHQERFQKEHGVKLGYMSFFVKATLSALKAYPLIHSRIEGDEIVTPNKINIGIAVSTEKGLIVPVLKNVELLSFAKIEQEIASFAKKAKEGLLLPEDLSGGSFTITNGGVFGSLFSTPIINPPESAILGMHKIQERPIALNGEVEIRPKMYVALSYDHRLIDGKEAISFLVHIKKCLEDPNTFLLES